MGFVKPEHSRKQVERAGDALRQSPMNIDKVVAAIPVISNWRAAHAYPLNTFQATLRHKLKSLGMDAKSAPVGQRLKRLPSIIQKLQRFDQMSLARMQDIAGLRAVVPSTSMLRAISRSYLEAERFPHELRTVHDYVQEPKADGYRSIHLVYRYQNPRAPAYEGLHVELQLRTKVQHAWATAVETVDTFANSAIKAGKPTPMWKEFFQLTSAAFAFTEAQPLPAAYRGMPLIDILAQLSHVEAELNVIRRLRGFSIAADKIQRGGRGIAAYHLVVLNTEHFDLSIQSFPERELDQATDAYEKAEERTARGEPIDAVLVAGGSIEQLKKTYPNYFLDASVFVKRVSALCSSFRRSA